KENQCSIYEEREKLSLDGCVEFPLYIAESLVGEDGFEGPFVIADYRCDSVEKNWEEISPILEDISERHDIEIRIKYLLEEDQCRRLDLKNFNILIGQGIIPPQG
ncbi:hypothetical protein ACFLZB_04650, partial [Nanoarchaeota archaeon]